MVSVLCSVEVVYSPVLTAKADKQKLSNFCRPVHDFVSLSFPLTTALLAGLFLLCSFHAG